MGRLSRSTACLDRVVGVVRCLWLSDLLGGVVGRVVAVRCNDAGVWFCFCAFCAFCAYLANHLTRGFLMRFLVLVLLAAVVGCADMTLHNAALDGDLYTVQYLVARGADVNARDFFGQTALGTAAGKGHLEVVEFLVGAGADVDARIVDDAVVEFLLGSGATALHRAAWRGHLEVVKVLVGSGASVNAADEEGETPLHFAAWRGHLEVVKVLVGSGASVNAANEEGETPLHEAAWKGQLDVVKYLVEQGASVNARARGWTARGLSVACSMDTDITDERRAGCSAVVSYLDSLAADG